MRATTRSASSRSAAATTADAGRLRATSAARLGPDRAATRPTGTPAASATTSLIRRRLPRSRPFTTDSRSAAGSRNGATAPTVVRRCADGAANSTRSVASRSAAGSAVATTPVGRSMPGSRASLRPVSRIRAAVSGEWHSSVTGSIRATTRASVVPHAPAPTTATRGPSISSCVPPAWLNLRGAAPFADLAGALRSFLRRGSLTDERSRKMSRTGVPSNPNFSRSWFSR